MKPTLNIKQLNHICESHIISCEKYLSPISLFHNKIQPNCWQANRTHDIKFMNAQIFQLTNSFKWKASTVTNAAVPCKKCTFRYKSLRQTDRAQHDEYVEVCNRTTNKSKSGSLLAHWTPSTSSQSLQMSPNAYVPAAWDGSTIFHG